jgi:hypothetical protein
VNHLYAGMLRSVLGLILGLISGLALGLTAYADGDKPVRPAPPMAIDRQLTILPAGDPSRALALAAKELGDWSIELAGVELNGPGLTELALPPTGEPLLRHVRETLGRPVDLEDLLYWLDDVAVAGRKGRRGEDFVLPSGRARKVGILLHPDDVFEETPRRYAATARQLEIDRPKESAAYPPALDGEVLGPRWTARYPNPSSREEMLSALSGARPDSDLATRIGSLLDQMEGQGAQVWLTSTVRRRERGYLMWGAYHLSRASLAEQSAALVKLVRLNEEWGLQIPILWTHPDGAMATREAARRMADVYEVAYATERGAKNSNHYGGVAVDLVALDLPRKLTLRAPDAEVRTFDLSDPTSARDLSLEPTLIAWIEKHFALRKLTSDYPHWTDVK